MPQTFTPTVLVVDDDPAILDILSRRFFDNTSLGVLTLDNLEDAHSVVVSGKVHIDAILSDLSFTPRTQDFVHHLFDGLDLIKFVLEHKPKLPNYICSVYSRESSYQERAKELGLELDKWFPKLEIDVEKPWHRIERDLYRAALEANKDLAEKARHDGLSQYNDDDLLIDWIRSSIRPVRQTYLQSLPAPFRTLLPIRVICEEDDNTELVSAEAHSLGLILPGQGESVEEALEDLGQIVVEQYKDFLSTDPRHIVGYAAKVFEKLKAYVIYEEKDFH